MLEPWKAVRRKSRAKATVIRATGDPSIAGRTSSRLPRLARRGRPDAKRRPPSRAHPTGPALSVVRVRRSDARAWPRLDHPNVVKFYECLGRKPSAARRFTAQRRPKREALHGEPEAFSGGASFFGRSENHLPWVVKT